MVRPAPISSGGDSSAGTTSIAAVSRRRHRFSKTSHRLTLLSSASTATAAGLVDLTDARSRFGRVQVLEEAISKVRDLRPFFGTFGTPLCVQCTMGRAGSLKMGGGMSRGPTTSEH